MLTKGYGRVGATKNEWPLRTKILSGHLLRYLFDGYQKERSDRLIQAHSSCFPMLRGTVLLQDLPRLR